MLGMFIDDGISDQHRYISVYWANLPTWRPADALITFGILGQIIPCILILFIRRIVIPSCIFLVMFESQKIPRVESRDRDRESTPRPRPKRESRVETESRDREIKRDIT
ncbi:unnamed protein product [Meloidogyne enterolobii]|uniref:Uncharacterized protein n=1 Tax=Meloidogyne enterolobii TaxID=390850 RepID=A0ACB0YAJ7_MELEN